MLYIMYTRASIIKTIYLFEISWAFSRPYFVRVRPTKPSWLTKDLLSSLTEQFLNSPSTYLSWTSWQSLLWNCFTIITTFKKYVLTYVGYGWSSGPKQFEASDKASPQRYFKPSPPSHFDDILAYAVSKITQTIVVVCKKNVI